MNFWFILGLVVLYQVAVIAVSGVRIISLERVLADDNSRFFPGQAIRLLCLYDLEGEHLYSVKWYRDDIEFFRYVPTEIPPIQVFPLPGINVDLANSFGGNVLIRNVNSSSSGSYRCEVSADAPHFETVSAEKLMAVPTSGKAATILSRRHKVITSLPSLLMLIYYCQMNV